MERYDEINRLRRREFGAFLRAHREALSPSDLGLPLARRRTRGLRREEVAMLAGIGVTWYTRLEMGLDVHASASTIVAIASALQLDPDEQRFLLDLEAADARGPRNVPAAGAPPYLAELVGATRGAAAIAYDVDWTACAANRLAREIFPFSEASGWRERNSIWNVFRNKARRVLYGEQWPDVAEYFAGMLRRNACLHPTERTSALVRELRGDPDFDAAWERFDVRSADRVAAADKPLRLDSVAFGPISVYVVDAFVPAYELRIRFAPPANDRTAAAFAAFERGA